MEPLKNIYNDVFFKSMVKVLSTVVPAFKKNEFLAAIQGGEWQQLELKQRIRRISTELGHFLPGNYSEQVDAICDMINHLQHQQVKQNSFPWLFLPDFLEVYGLQDMNISLNAMEIITAYISCEFAVRPFLLADPETVMKKMMKWSKHSNENVRRFSSEGCRPRLPWGKAIPSFKKDPSPILPILENLMDDPSEFVRKSVANNINDIAKDHPDIVLNLIKKWKSKSKNTDWILRHGARTLLRKADPGIYKQFGLSGSHDCELSKFTLSKKSISLGKSLELEFSLNNKASVEQLFRVELGVYYMKSGGSSSRKLFKITENTFEPSTIYKFKRRIDFTDLTTRKHYAGKHAVSIVVNGKELETKYFNVSRN
ncbi:DNA alkylation repair protein [Flavitalea sp.]|nr:DNA alkylation repair protein [Flavitalea sp.]